MTQYTYEFGKRWNAKVPRNDITWLMGRIHVAETNEHVTAEITKRCKDPGYTAAIIKQSVAYALECHKRNRALYDRVTRGNY